MEPIDSLTADVARADLEDVDETTSFDLARIDLALLTSPVVLRALGGIAIGLALLVWPDRSDRILTRLLGLAVAWLALASLRAALSTSRRSWVSVAGALPILALGLFLLALPDRSTVVVGRLIGLALVAFAGWTTVKNLRSGDADRGRLAVMAVLAATGLVLIALTESMLSVIVTVGALIWIGVSLLALVVSLDATTPGTATLGDTIGLVSRWLLDRPKSVDARQALYAKILYEGPTARTRIIRFFTLMGFAAVIASMGVITDSTAVVIGAMLIAPLMTPLMGMAISLVMGWPNRLTRSSVIAVGGILLSIGIGVLLGLIAPADIDTTTNAQIVARSSPTILDLVVAVAAGAAGAYGLSRPDVSDSLPGVAIAISLVPPLTVVGIAYSQTDWRSGTGALLLFATNMLAILMVGGLTFVLTGVTPLARVAENQHRVRTAIGVTCTAAVVVLGLLLSNGGQIAADALRQSTVDRAIEDWVAQGRNHRLVDAVLDDDRVTAVVIGPSDGLPALDELADRLTDDLGRPITVDVSLVVEERLTATGG